MKNDKIILKTTMPDYQKGMIYKIVNNQNDKIYFGSTIQPLHKRLYHHKTKHNECMSRKLEVDLKDCKIILVEKYACNSKYELEKRERYYIENFECVNKNIPTRSIEEWRQDNRNKIKQYYQKNKQEKLKKQNEYSQKNKDKIKKIKKEYYQKNKEQFLKKQNEYNQKNKEELYKKHEEYRQKNKDKIKKIKKEYYQKNKVIISCFHCLKQMTKQSYNRHLKTCQVIN